MAEVEPGREPLRSRWRCLSKPVVRSLNALQQRLARRREMEVFPWLEHVALGAAIVGASLGFGAGWVGRLDTNGLLAGTLLGSLLGGLIAVGLKLSGAVVPAAVVVTTPVPEPIDLWDPWLDQRDAQETEASNLETSLQTSDDEGAAGPVEERVIVRPRVVSSESGESVPLEGEIGPWLARHERGVICVSGPSGSGKSTALSYLAGRVPAHFQVAFLDQPHPLHLAGAMERGLVVCTLTGPGRPKLLTDFKLAPWGKDDWIEYLLGIAPSRCGSVMARLAGRETEQSLLQGNPELWRIVLDRMAADVAIEGPRQALRIELDACFHDRRARERTEAECLRLLLDWRPGQTREDRDVYGFSVDDPLTRLLRHQAIQLLLAAHRFADNLARGAECNTLASSVRQDLISETALQLADRPEAVAFLKHLIADSDERRHPLAASLLHALRIGWKPDQPPPRLTGAYLEEADWPGIELEGADLREVRLRRANLSGARFARARFDDAQLAGADLRTASIGEARFDRADLTQARLAKVQARVSRFEAACLRGADLELADLDGANFLNADLRGARLTLASMAGAILKHVKIEGADFTCANLSKAILSGLNLTEARFDNAWFAGAKLFRCNLEGMTLPHAIFAGAELAYALMTGSSMPDADFRDAYLCQAGLAEVEWERADLRNADLRGAAFHLGSTRSGLVGSPFPCEGSRTGFYTDDYDEQDFKSPEEIRKANLCGADLRGARIDGVDFYLVDLRGARVDPEQVSHLRRCGAILESRV